MPRAETLLRRIEAFCRATGTAESTFGRTAVNDGKLVTRLRAGGSITLKTLQRIEAALVTAIETEPNSVDRMIGSRIRLRRRQLGLSQQSLAAMLGTRPERLREFEEGTARAGAARLCAIARTLEVPISFFFSGLSGANASQMDAGPSASLATAPGAAELLSAYVRIESPPLRRAVLAVANYLAHEGCESRRPDRTGAIPPRSSKWPAH